MTSDRNRGISCHWLRVGAAAVVALLAAAPAWAQNAIKSITSSASGTSEVLLVQLEQPLAAVPQGFVVQSPARIALDLPGVVNGTGQPTVEVGQGNIRSVNFAQTADRTRLVLNLKQATSYTARVAGNVLQITLAPAATSSVPGTPSATTHFAESGNTVQQAIANIDFRRMPSGAGAVVVTLPNDQTGVDIRQQGADIVVDLLRTSLPAALRRRLDVMDYGTPVQTVSATQAGDNVRLTVHPTGDWEQSAYQTGNQFVLEVHKREPQPNKLTQGPGYSGAKLTLNFQNVDIRQLLAVIADFTNFNIITSDSVTGNLTLRLKDVPWDQALDIILQSKGLDKRKNGNVIWIAPKDEIAAKEKAQLETESAITDLEPLRTQSFQLNYTKASDVAAALRGGSTGGLGVATQASGPATNSILSKRGSVVVDARTNQIFVTDIAGRLEQVQTLITKLDIPVRQVMIEARIVEATDDWGRSLGMKLGGSFTGSKHLSVGGANYGTDSSSFDPTSNDGNPTSGSTSSYVNFFNFPASAINGQSASSIGLSIFNSSASRILGLEIQALEATEKGRVISSPRVVTADQVKALVEQGTELPYQNATSSGATSVEFKKANLSLAVTPQITPDGSVILDVDVNKDTPGTLTSAGYAIDTKHVQTNVLVENGGTVVIGGIFTQTETDTVSKVPLLGDIPILGNLFKSNNKVNNRTELIIFLTPRIITSSVSGSVR